MDLDQCFFYLEEYPGTSQSWDTHMNIHAILKRKHWGTGVGNKKKSVLKDKSKKEPLFTLKFLYTFSIFIKNAFLFLQNMDSGGQLTQSTCCSWRGSGLVWQHLHGGLHSWVTPVPGYLTLTSDLHRHKVCTQYTCIHICKQNKHIQISL